MSEILDRVSEAVRIAQKAWWDSDKEPETSLDDVVARAAIAAMREPTKEMIAAGECYRCMIDAALK